MGKANAIDATGLGHPPGCPSPGPGYPMARRCYPRSTAAIRFRGVVSDVLR